MEIAREIDAARAAIAGLPRPVGFVPTMGALHAGHLRLVERCNDRCASSVVSVFVNPAQFGPGEDFDRYPRDEAGDRAELEAARVTLLFMPSVAAMYPQGASTTIDVGAIAQRYEGAARPNHFRGVVTVVAKLLHIVAPDVLYVGQKDAQQAAVLAKLLRDLDFGVRLDVIPTVREPDGLALSSRNAYLNEEERSRCAESSPNAARDARVAARRLNGRGGKSARRTTTPASRSARVSRCCRCPEFRSAERIAAAGLRYRRGTIRADALNRQPHGDAVNRDVLSDARILLCVSGGIAAYKAAAVTSTLVQRGAIVDVMMTQGAERFITPLTFAAITARPVYASLWDAPERIPHIRLVREAQVMLVAPATANVLAKAAHGIADDLVTSALLAARIPIVAAPAMNDAMYRNPITQENLRRLRERGYTIVEPEFGFLAEREAGIGRLAAEDAIRCSAAAC